jgi:hypothetical protein
MGHSSSIPDPTMDDYLRGLFFGLVLGGGAGLLTGAALIYQRMALPKAKPRELMRDPYARPYRLG